MFYGIFIGKYNKATMGKVGTLFFSNMRYYYSNGDSHDLYKIKTALSPYSAAGMFRAGPAILVFWSE